MERVGGRRAAVSFACLFCGVILLSVFAVFRHHAAHVPTSKVPFIADQPLEHSLSRKIRQAYPVYTSGQHDLTVDASRNKESGPWGEWVVIRDCSRTCGGGVLIETRSCLESGCIGPKKRYVSCNIEPCPGESNFRAEQCAKFNEKPLEGKYYSWKPYTRAPNKCELSCIPEGENFYYKWADKVIDGTKCDAVSNDICVEGYCLPLGCNNMLGSSVKEDKCRVCDGDGSSCKTLEGFFDESDLEPGYHDIITLPHGATSILVKERKPTNNYLGTNESGHYFLNGNWKIDFPQSVDAAGTTFEYERIRNGRVAFESLYAKGPIKEPVTVVLLYQSDKTGIQYEYSIPLEDSYPYFYLVDKWSTCSVTCGQGISTRRVVCVERDSKRPVPEETCFNLTIPEMNKTCNTVDCMPGWIIGEWEPCSESCGTTGVQFRVVFCTQVLADGTKVSIPEEQCTGMRPAVSQECNRFACPEWHAGPWSACSSPCGDAFQYRSVTCLSEKPGAEGAMLGAKACNATAKPRHQRSCNLGPCKGLGWVMSPWKLCEKCNDTTEYRNVSCQDQNGRMYPDEKCAQERPIDERDCATVIPCVYLWHSSQWSKCSTKCGHGHMTRSVVCAIEEDRRLIKVDESHCDPNFRPENRQNCTSEEKCTGTYFTSLWSECSAPCGGGFRNRTVLCFDYDFRINPDMCDESQKPAETQACNEQPCENCADTEFGCCPDNVTVAEGPYLEGCSNCSLSGFGCCPDNITQATGSDFEGCEPEEVLPEVVEGSGVTGPAVSAATEEALNATTTEEPELCNYTSPNGTTVEIPCVNITDLPLLNESLATINETSDNVSAEIHCSKTEFGCCPDWYTSAEGPDNEGCSVYELGSCHNTTKFGCCLDNVTLARGPNYEGCGDPGCSASLYGCCQDRRTIAFGPHYKGCERSSLNCESSTFGCCPDGKTAALGHRGEGCEENCLLSKYGCCPDGVTSAEGPNFLGCGCAYTQYGCCPDGKTVATGPTFYGCPESCVVSYYGCCPDMKSYAKGPNFEGCPCAYSRYGCCPDGTTVALGPEYEGCFGCSISKFGCCPDGKTPASGLNFEGCDIGARPAEPQPVPPQVSTPPVAESTEPFSINRIATCTLPPETGDCSNYVLKWHYEPKEGACQQFWYGGCGGNENRFVSQEECENTCITPPGDGVCYLPKITGPERCATVTERWFYNIQRGMCTSFQYRCNGNVNNFDSYNSCMSRCGSVHLAGAEPSGTTPGHESIQPSEESPSTTPASTPQPEAAALPGVDACTMLADPGHCRDRIEMWYYDKAVGECQQFVYTGCGGNVNRFSSKDECEHQCIKPLDYMCTQVKDPGPCDTYVAKWYFNGEDGTCGRFYYGGCQGNDNRFETLDECDEHCASRTDPCTLPSAPGPCSDRQVRFFYNHKSRQCEQFNFGGCLGNSNNFQTMEQCKKRCEKAAAEKTTTTTVTTPVATTQPAIRVEGKVIGGMPITAFVTPSTEPPRADICALNHDPGPCRAYIPMYYHDYQLKQCLPFVYGGCRGNLNRFSTIEECENICKVVKYQNIVDANMIGADRADNLLQPITEEALVSLAIPGPQENICELPPVAGPCRAAVPRWYYDSRDERCHEFLFSGCGGNENSFNSEAECERACGDYKHKGALERPPEGVEQSKSTERPQVPRYYPYPTSVLPDLCTQPQDAGSCYGRTLSWFYDSEKMQCGTFLYSGCGGNSNRFLSEEACERACGLYRDQDVCTLPPDEGPCLASVQKWYYKTDYNVCEVFVYGGCEGNGNRFTSKEECENTCVREAERADEQTDVCSLTRDPGPCLEPVSQWYFDKAAGECKLFTYGGCRGNDNRFNSREECETRCVSSTAPTVSLSPKAFDEDTCYLEFEVGPCRAAIYKWYFDAKSHKCREFIYGGCLGNENRFDSEQECLSKCGHVPKKSYDRVKPKRRGLYVDVKRQQFKEGQSILMDCRSDRMNIFLQVAWYKDGKRLQTDSARRVEVHINGSLSISSSVPSDSGNYSCALLTPHGSISHPVRIIVEGPETETEQECVDNPLLANCRLVVTAGLCDHKYYGQYCCQSCQTVRHQKLRKRHARA